MTPCRACTRVHAAVAYWTREFPGRKPWETARSVERYENLAAIAKKARERGRHFHLLETL